MKLIAGSGPWYNSDVEWFDQMKASLQEAQISLQMLHSLEGGGRGRDLKESWHLVMLEEPGESWQVCGDLGEGTEGILSPISSPVGDRVGVNTHPNLFRLFPFPSILRFLPKV